MEALEADLEEVARGQKELWQSLSGARIFMTGATGFFGAWQLALIEHARKFHGLDCDVTILSRSQKDIPGVRVIAGDVRTFAFPKETFTHVIHGATSASAALNEGAPLEMFDVVLEGTRRVMEFAGACGAKRVMHVSSGAVYGAQPPALTHVPEDHLGGPSTTDIKSAHHESKRAAELLAVILASKHGLELTIARGFAFCAPYLPLDIHFAVGNFIRDGLAHKPIRILGDGTPYRSYMYGSDLALWLYTILQRGKHGSAYNVGSEDGRSLAEIAQIVGKQTGVIVEIAKKADPNVPPSRYVPSTQRARDELGLRLEVGLEDAIARTIAFHRAQA